VITKALCKKPLTARQLILAFPTVISTRK